MIIVEHLKHLFEELINTEVTLIETTPIDHKGKVFPVYESFVTTEDGKPKAYLAVTVDELYGVPIANYTIFVKNVHDIRKVKKYKNFLTGVIQQELESERDVFIESTAMLIGRDLVSLKEGNVDTELPTRIENAYANLDKNISSLESGDTFSLTLIDTPVTCMSTGGNNYLFIELNSNNENANSIQAVIIGLENGVATVENY